MYYPIGWPKIVDVVGLNDATIRQICCDRVKILFATLTDDSLAIYYTNVNKRNEYLLNGTTARCMCAWAGCCATTTPVRPVCALIVSFHHRNNYNFCNLFLCQFSFMQPCVPIVITRRTPDSIAKHGTNCFVEWKPDSNMLVVAVSFN